MPELLPEALDAAALLVATAGAAAVPLLQGWRLYRPPFGEGQTT